MTDKDKIKNIVTAIINCEYNRGTVFHCVLTPSIVKSMLQESKGNYYYFSNFIKENIETFNLFGIDVEGEGITYNGKALGWRVPRGGQ